MTVLGIETSTEVCSVGLVKGDTGAERSIRESRIHSEQLLPLVREVMQDANAGWDEIGGVALSAGPGSFTGLRIGASAVKGILTAVQRPFTLVPTFEAMHAAWEADGSRGRACVIALDAKQDEWYVQEFPEDGAASPLRLMATAGLTALVNGRSLLTDRPERFSIVPGPADVTQWCSGASVARLGRERLLQGRTDDPGGFEPLYWKEFVVRTTPKAVTPRAEAKET